MASETRQEVRQLFMELADLPLGERPAALSRLCGSNTVLRAEVEALLQADQQASGFMDSPTAIVSEEGATIAEGGESNAAPLREVAGARIGPYKLLQLIGQGGFGSVFMAEQEQPVQRKVALKIIKLGMDTRQVVARFEQERQALAMMDHPNIAKVLDAGATQTGRPYFVMELVKGSPIVDYCDKNNLSIESRLELFAQVCTAVQHAHTKGIIHRDLKPSNILVNSQDGRPNAKVIDFGIAKATQSKLTEKTLFTEHQQLIGTPEYMSPEQAEGSLDIDTRTDVYSLGVLLYELLTSSTPFSGRDLQSAAYAEIQRIIRDVDPPRPSTRLSQSSDRLAIIAAHRRTEPRRLGTMLRGELDWIVMKALEKDRQRRYETASGLAMDVRRFLAGEPVAAVPPSAVYRIRKAITRNKGFATATAAVAAALIVGVLAFGWQARVATSERDRARTAEAQTAQRASELAQVSTFQAKMLNQIDTAQAGMDLMQSIQSKFEKALEKAGVEEEQRGPRAKAFAAELVRVNATDTASELIDRTMLVPALATINSQFKEQPVVDASLRYTLSEVYAALGMSVRGLELQQEALVIRKRELGDSHPDTLASLNNIGSLLEATGKLTEAEVYTKDAYESRVRVLGPDDPETLMSMSNLGNYYRSQGKFAEAEPLLRGALQGNRKVRGNAERATLVSMNTLGYLMIASGKPAEAEPLWREAYTTGRQALGEDDRDVLVWTANLGSLLQMQGKLPEAEALLLDALARHRRVRGEDHPGTIMMINSVANHYSKRGDQAKAELLLRDALEKSTRVLGADHPSTLTCSLAMGYLLVQGGHLSEAEPYIRGTLETRRRVLGVSHPQTLESVGVLATLFVQQNKAPEAILLYRESLDAARRTLGSEASETLVQMVNLGHILLTQKDLTQAEVLLREAAETRRRVWGPNDTETLVAESNYARVLEEQGKIEVAEQMFIEILVRFRATIGSDHPNTLNGMGNVASLMRSRGAFVDAEPLYRESVTGLEKRVGKDNLRTAQSRLGLAKTLIELKRFEEGEKELVEVHRVLSTAQGVSLERVEACVKSFITLYEAWDVAAPGQGHDLKAKPWKEWRAPSK